MAPSPQRLGVSRRAWPLAREFAISRGRKSAAEAAAPARGFKIMVGCNIGTSLAMAPAVLLAQDAEFVDLDAPLLLAVDRSPGLRYDGSTFYPPGPALWG
jgi:L-alanine-DL-glutamate epimerase-like enolase superfamily enzyme